MRAILNEKELMGTALNGKVLGERKNCNLPGVMVDLPVLGPKDVEDVQNFACKCVRGLGLLWEGWRLQGGS